MKTDTMSAPLALFTCRPTSHPFQERQIVMNEPVKIGRSVARARPAPNNAIFDCKVLSRNHALLWYEDNKFYLQDTKSSNGTFVNSQRLSKGAEESAPREIFSGDIIQFGVDVMENSRRVTHGCIIATVTLYNSDGSEAKPAFDNSGSTLCSQTGTAVSSQELYQLSQYLQEALQREQMLESKLATLQRLLDNTQKASESSWQALIDEDRLLSRLESLQSQLSSYTKAQTEGSLLEQLAAVHADKSSYECTAKETLRKVLEEKLEAVHKLSDLERSLSNAEEECNNARSLYESARAELAALADVHDQKIAELQEAHDKLKDVQRAQDEDAQRHEEEARTLRERVDDLLLDKSRLAVRVDDLLAAHDRQSSEQEANMRNANFANEDSVAPKIESSSLDDADSATSQTVTGGQVEVMEKQPFDGSLEDTVDESIPVQQRLLKAVPTDDVSPFEGRLKTSEARVADLVEREVQWQKQLEQAQLQVVEYITKVASLEEKLRQLEGHASQSIESACADLRLQLGEALAQGDRAASLAKSLEDDVKRITLDRDAHEIQVQELLQELESTRSLHSSQSDLVLAAQSAVQSSQAEARLLQAKVDAQQEENAKLRAHLLTAEAQAREAAEQRHSQESSAVRLRAEHGELVEAREAWQATERSLLAQLAAARSDSADAKAKLRAFEEEAAQLKDVCDSYSSDVASLNATVDSLSQKLAMLASRSHVISLCALGPLLLLVFAIGIALHPSLSWLTATTDP